MTTWNPGLAIGHPVIDKQHRELFAQADKLVKALRRGEATTQVMQQLQFLQAYCQHHFRSEELLMRQLAYPSEAPHRAAHGVFERRFRTIERKALANGESVGLALELSALIRGWLIDHIAVEDVKIAGFVRENPQGAPLRPAEIATALPPAAPPSAAPPLDTAALAREAGVSLPDVERVLRVLRRREPA